MKQAPPILDLRAPFARIVRQARLTPINDLVLALEHVPPVLAAELLVALLSGGGWGAAELSALRELADHFESASWRPTTS